MSFSLFGALPPEMIAYVAGHCSASTVINLSYTNKTVRSLVWNSLVMVEVIRNSQRYVWRSDSLDLQAVLERCKGDVQVAARFAVADDKAWVLSQNEKSLAHLDDRSYLPELMVVKHPFVYSARWRQHRPTLVKQSYKQAFCYGMAVLFMTDRVPEVEESLMKHNMNTLSMRSGPKYHYLALCIATTAIRSGSTFDLSNSPWQPVNAPVEKEVPRCVKIPCLSGLPLRPMTKLYQVPVPFVEGTWQDYHASHINSMVSKLPSGTWNGYVIPSNSRDLQGALHLLNVHWTQTSGASVLAELDASNMQEAFGFASNEVLTPRGLYRMSFSMVVTYGEARIRSKLFPVNDPRDNFVGDLRLTPFGLTGFGKFELGREGIHARDMGSLIWLCNTDWSERQAP